MGIANVTLLEADWVSTMVKNCFGMLSGCCGDETLEASSEGGVSLGPDCVSVACRARGNNRHPLEKMAPGSGSFHVCQEMQGEVLGPDQLNSNLKLQCLRPIPQVLMGVGSELYAWVRGRISNLELACVTWTMGPSLSTRHWGNEEE